MSEREVGVGAMDEEQAQTLCCRLNSRQTHVKADRSLSVKDEGRGSNSPFPSALNTQHHKTFLERYGVATYQELKDE